MPATALLAIVLSVAGCALGGSTSGHDQDGELTVFAAASLTDVFEDLEERWRASHPDLPLATTFDGSNVLAAQIAEGAPADVFVAADTQRPTELAAAGHTAGEPVPFGRNRVTIAVRLDDGPMRTATDLADPGIRLVAAGVSVPITRYADAALAQLAATTEDPRAFLEHIAANVVSREDNVRAALAKVELGEGDAAVVYATDVRASRLVREIPFPAAVDVTAEYAAVRISDHPGADELLDWLRGPEAGAILEASGFEPDDDRA